MKKQLFQRAICFVLSVATLFSVVAVSVFASGGNLKENNTASTLEEMQSLVKATTYAEYIANYAGEGAGSQTHVMKWEKDSSSGVKEYSEFKDTAFMPTDENWYSKSEEVRENSLYLDPSSKATWSVELSEEDVGLYYIKIEYYSCNNSQSSISPIEKKLLIDGSIPFSEAGTLEFSKAWEYNDVVNVETSDTDEEDSYSVSYQHIATGKEKDGEEAGYYKVVTVVEDGKKTVTTHRIKQDINGNSMTPEAVQVPEWNTYFVQDNTGYYTGYQVGEQSHSYFCFYMLNGTRTVTLEAIREPMIVSSVELVPIDGSEENSLKSYAEYIADCKDEYSDFSASKENNTSPVEIQAEFPDLVSDSSVYATNDNTSAATYPSVAKSQLYNVIGENSYNTVGQWAAYKFTVNESGFYKFGMRYKQTGLQGMYICRTIKLSGGQYGSSPTVPFSEAYSAEFKYDKNWQSTFVTDGSGVPFEFYFEKGVEYTVYLECSLGSLKTLIQRVENAMNKINDSYLKILQLTGNDPDEYRDYGFKDIMPEVLYELLVQAKELMNVKEELDSLCEEGAGSHTATLETIAVLLDKMGSDEGIDIAANMSTLKSYLGTLGTWINNSKTSSMLVDSITVAPSDYTEKDIPKAKANFFKSIAFEIKAFFYSFIVDYDLMGLESLPDEDSVSVDVWLATGRDQSNIWRSLIDAEDSFTSSTGVAATLKLVTGGTLLPSILSGKGPDVYIGLGSADVINYAIRNAVMGVSGTYAESSEYSHYNEIFSSTYYTYKDKDGNYYMQYEDGSWKDGKVAPEGSVCTYTSLPFEQVITDPETGDNFAPAAMDTVRLLGTTYGIPQTMSFSMMFYRMDVLAELGEEVPESWDELLSLLPVLQSNNMDIGVSYIAAIDFMIYQKGGNMWKYIDNEQYAGAEVDLDSIIALEAFDYVCRLFSDYSFPVTYDAANRFRTGEMPIVIGDYAGMYNQLVVYATEIAGLWEFTSLPGSYVLNEDGSEKIVNGEKVFNYDSLAGVTATVMLHGCEDVLAAWQFIQWQCGAEVQAEYGNRMVALIGPSAKYESANLKALNDLSWTASEKEAIQNQMENLSSIVNYPGSYIISRYTKFAFLDVVNEGADPIDAMTGYIDDINAEIQRKRKEFNLPTEFPGEE